MDHQQQRAVSLVPASSGQIISFILGMYGGAVLAGETSLEGALREVQEELGISLKNAGAGRIIYQTKRDQNQDFYDVWLFEADIDTTAIRLQPSEVVSTKWVNRNTLFAMYEAKKLHPNRLYRDNILKRFNKRWMVREFERKSVKSDSEPGQRQTATHHAGDSFVLPPNGYDVLIEKGSSFTILESILIRLHNSADIIKRIVV